MKKKPNKALKEMAFGLVIGIITIVAMVAFVKNEGKGAKNLLNSERSVIATNPNVLQQSFWHFEFGSSVSECGDILKELMKKGEFEELSKGKVALGWLPGATTLTGSTSKGWEIDLDGMLSNPINSLELYFIDDKLVGIKLRSFLGKPPEGVFESQAKDMEVYFGVKAIYSDEENEVGNKKSYYRLTKGNITTEIVKQYMVPIAPDIYIYDNTMVH
jgi:hypothetical protein